MKNSIIRTNNSVSRRETITMLASAGLFSLPGISWLDRQTTLSMNKAAKTMKEGNNGSTMKTIGILGGLGPQATMDLEMRIHRAAQQLIPSQQNSGYPPMIVQYYRHPPVLLTKDNVPVSPWQPDPRMLEVAKHLGVDADFIIIPSNGAHLFQKEIEQAAGRNVVSMIEVTLAEVKRKNWKKAGVLGLMNPKVYTTRLKETGIAFEIIDDSLQEKLNIAIMKTMEGREDDNDRSIALQAINLLRDKKVDGIIPGCTEIPLLLGQHMNATDLINPAQLLAEAAVRYCLS